MIVCGFPGVGKSMMARWEVSYWNIKTPIIAWMPLPEPYRGGDSE